MDEILEKLNKLSREVLILSRNTLLINLRFLDMALSRLELMPIEEPAILTDGRYILYSPRYVLENYKKAKEIPVRDYLHMVMHCVFRHMYVDSALDRVYWDLACDIAVENMIIELGVKATYCEREAEQKNFIAGMRKNLKYVTAESIYSYLRQTVTDYEKADKVRKLFYADNHEIWYMTDEEKSSRYGFGNSDNNTRVGNDSQSSNSGQNNQSSQSSYSSKESREEIAEDWKRISERMQIDLETFAQQHGEKAGSMVQNLIAVNREKYDYASFLKKFATTGEAMRINDDEFDYIYYTYGLQLYEKMPLIEPLEYKDIKAIKEFVIAIDTSGSTSGELVQSFVQKTYNILKSTESFFTKINLHIIQCDAEIQETVKITCQEEFDNYIENMTIKGLGGTDFRPVFSYVDSLIAKKEFANLKGMIYFTDGFGTFPKKQPSYDVAVVYVEEDYENPEVPVWAIKLILQPDDIRRI